MSFKCLVEESECRVGNSKMTRPHSNQKAVYARTVVVYVRLTDRTGDLIFHARYGNCFQAKRKNGIHAEHFMLEDEEFIQYVKLLREGKIEMYMNKQPCFKSTRVKSKKCAQDLADFYDLYCLSRKIKLTINVCQLYKVDMRPSPPRKEDIENAREGVRRMMFSGIELQAMDKESWRQLAGYANIILPEYIDSDRKKLDQHIEEFFESIKSTLPLPSVLHP